MKLTGTLTLWTTVLALSSRAQEAECNYYDGHDRCLNPDATASVTIDIKPLFSSPPTLVYAIDNLTDTQIAIEDDKYGDGIWWRSNYKGGQIQKIGFWMEYDEDSLNYTESSERTYQLAVIFTRSPNSIGGSDGGCEQLLGSECVDGLRDTFRWNGIGYDNWPDLMKRPLRNISCPMDIFEDDLLLSCKNIMPCSSDLELTADSNGTLGILCDREQRRRELAAQAPSGRKRKKHHEQDRGHVLESIPHL